MKILVIDDSEKNQKSAIETLKGHEVTVIGSFDEAVEVLKPDNGYEAVLCDLMMPMSDYMLTKENYKPGELVPYGFALALRAVTAGAKYVLVATDLNHHHNAISASLDVLAGNPYDKEGDWNCSYINNFGNHQPKFTINGAHVCFIHAAISEDGSKIWDAYLKSLMDISANLI